MDIILYLIAGLAAGALIGWLLGKSNGRTEWEKKNGSIQQQYIELEKEFVGYRATQTAHLSNIQQQLQGKIAELIASQQLINEVQHIYCEFPRSDFQLFLCHDEWFS